MVSQQERKENSVRKFLKAAEALLSEKGYEGTTVQAILDHTGLSRGAFYHYFASKDDLFWSLFQSKANQVREEFWSSVSSMGGLSSPTEVMVRNTLRLSMDPVIQIIYSHYFSIASHNQEAIQRVRDIHNLWRSLAEEGIGTAQAAGLVPKELDVQKISVMIVGLTSGVGLQISPEPQRFPFEQYAKAVQLLILAMFQCNDLRMHVDE